MTTSLEFAPIQMIAGDPECPYLFLCDHASNALPPEYGTLGLDAAEFERHIAYDIGARGVTLGLAERLGAPVIMTTFSRLLIDPNRGKDDPTLIMRLSDGAVVPGNANITPEERAKRLASYYEPYDQAITDALIPAINAGTVPALVSIHSFTPQWKAMPRPWEIGVLWDRDPRLAVPLIAALQKDTSLTVGDNEPYSGELPGDTMNRHGTAKGIAHALIELRQDLIADEAGVDAWVDRLAPILDSLRHQEGLNAVYR